MNDHDVRHTRCPDAVVLIPGLTGSRLVDAAGAVVWDLRPGVLARQLTHGDLLDRLHVTPTDGIRADGLVRFPALLPGLASLDPYGALISTLRQRTLLHRDALLCFAYDWRQPIADSAALLATAVRAHLEAWRAHPDGSPDARLWLIGHSLGGLVARYFTKVLDTDAITHQTITLGTPYYGSLRVMAPLANGHVLPLRLLAKRLRDLCRTLPSVYELCPTYACVTTTDPHKPRQLQPSDLSGIGANPDLAARASDTHSALAIGAHTAMTTRALVGITQPTPQTASLDAGTVELHEHIQGENRAGDGTVYRDAAAPPGVQPDYLPHRHNSLAATPEAVAFIQSVLTERPLGPPMGGPEVGIEPPPTVEPGMPFTVRVIADPDQRVHCHATDADTGRPAGAAAIAKPGEDGELAARLTLPRPGIYTIHAKAGGTSAVTEHVLCTDAPA